jgi:hypothetical protein
MIKTNKHKDSKLLRRELVHSAGCVEPNCATHYVRDKKEFNFAIGYFDLTKPVSVPKSLRHLLGRYLTKENIK